MSPAVATLDAARWRVVYQPRPAATARLYCLPFAGGAASFYRGWAGAMSPNVEVRCVELPGRHNRWQEPPLETLDDVVESLAEALGPELGGLPFACFGHSMGALLAFELARLLRRQGRPGPVLLAVSAHPAPDDLPGRIRLGALPDEELWDRLRGLGGIPDDIGSSPQLRELFLPALRADLCAVETYVHRPEPPLSCPISVFGGDADVVVPRNRLAGWHRHANGPVTTRVFGGGHFYLEDNDAVLRALAADLATRI
jgi:surfactin synthase thioesterase subunit